MLDNQAIEDYLKPLTSDQVHAIRSVRALVLDLCPNLVETIDQGKWFGGLLTYNTSDGVFAYALGPRTGGYTTFHMMPYYASVALQERHGAALKKFLSGKSCIRFKHYSDVPEDSLRDILDNGKAVMETVRDQLNKRKK